MGVKGGINFCNWKGSNAKQTLTLINFYGGALIDFPSSSPTFSIRAEILYSGEGSREANGSDKINMGYINVPVVLLYKNANGFFADAGFEPGALLFAKEKAGGVDLTAGFNRGNISLIAGLGYMIAGGFAFEARYNYGIFHISKAASDKVTSNVVSLGIIKMIRIKSHAKNIR